MNTKELKKVREEFEKDFTSDYPEGRQLNPGASQKEIWSFISKAITQAHEQGRQEALDEDLEESETRADIAKENYSAGYIDARKGRKKAPHDTRDGWCCSCEYDLAVMEEKIKEAEKRSYERGAKNQLLLDADIAKEAEERGYKRGYIDSQIK